jgi:ribonuclease HIII
MANSNSYVCNITPEQAVQLRELLEIRGWEFSTLPYARYKASGDKVSATAYESGKLVIQGKGTEEFVLYTLEPEILHTFTYQSPAVAAAVNAAEEITPHGGVDESGKGDFFGPLVIAGVAVTLETGKALRELGVCDSKQIHSSAKILKLAGEIRNIVPGAFTTVTLMPETYNRLYAKIGNLNRLLAWGHARVIENLLEQCPACPRMLSDKFGDERLIRNALMERGRQIIMEQQVRAEADVAVAAASILAREGFLRGMDKLEEIAGIPLPRGASSGVKAAAEKLFAEKGAELFRSCAKLHFKTWHEISGL